jgi:hypothetical protein
MRRLDHEKPVVAGNLSVALRMWRPVLFGCMITVFPCLAMNPGIGDTLHVFLAGDAAVTWQRPSGIKGSEDGFMRVTLAHEFNRSFSAKIGVRGHRSLPVPFLEQGALSWRGRTGEASGGFLTCRHGIDRYYKTRTTLNPLFEKPVVWDAYGFGFGASARPGVVVVQGAALMNNRESGSVCGYAGVETPGFSSGFLCGFQTYSVDDQDNNLVLGFESARENDAVKVHGAVRYVHGFGYSATSKTALPEGNRADGFVEARITPVPVLTVDVLALYRQYRKWYAHSEALAGIDVRWLCLSWSGIGGGTEWMKSDGIVTWSPEAYLFAAPVRDQTMISIGIRGSRTMRSSPLYQLTGNICVSF